MTDRAIETSPQTYATIGGVLYLIIIAIGLLGEAFVREKVIWDSHVLHNLKWNLLALKLLR
jgi:hypothetical protein